MDVLITLGGGTGDGLEEDGLAGLGRRYDEATLAPPDRGDEIDDARRKVVDAFLEMHHLVGKDRRQLLKVGALLGGLRVEPVDRVHAQKTKVLLGVLRLPDGAHHVIARAQGEAADLRLRYVDVADAWLQALRTQEAVAVVRRIEDSAREIIAFALGLGLHDFKDEVLLAQTIGAADVELLGDLDEFVFALGFEFSKVQGNSICVRGKCLYGLDKHGWGIPQM